MIEFIRIFLGGVPCLVDVNAKNKKFRRINAKKSYDEIDIRTSRASFS
ncbi:MAG: hypothetical protein IIW10_07180 [Spirochaetaceae bacterium]|nr:hypothetical protein [Spirochaetaceae bacterium]